MLFNVLPIDNFGNRMLAFMVAQAVAQRLAEPVRFNVGLAEWGLDFDRALYERSLEDAGQSCWFNDADATSLDEMVSRIMRSGAQTVVFRGYFQRFALFRGVEFYRALFPLQPLDIPPYAADEIVINIRAGEILSGHCAWYPLVPPVFYKILAAQTGYRLVLLGQLDDSLYLREILRLCPTARLIPSGGAIVDFNRLRHARRICVAISTFSWLAAWLSGAQEIHYPALGFLHPFCLPKGSHDGGGVDLTPLGDLRYRYHLFPLLKAAPELEYLQFTATFSPIALPVPESLMARLAVQAAQLTGGPRCIADVCGLYIKDYPDAAWSISLGHYTSAAEHYEQLGRFHGYQRFRLETLAWRLRRPNLALGKPALQSSVSPWSHFPDAAADAGGAVNGKISDTYGFHTQEEEAPWWRVDLEAQFQISDIWLFNRIEHRILALRAGRLALDVGVSEMAYSEVFRYDSDQPFGGVDGRPLIITLPAGTIGRYVRVRLLQRECLHLAQVEIYGTPARS